MNAVLIILLLLSWVVFVISVLLQSAKGGLWVAIGWVSSGGDYGSKKSLETSLKRISWISGIVFVVIALFLPFLGG